MRAFVAIDVPGSTPGGSDRSIAPTHLTLRFLGEIPRERAAALTDRLLDVGRHSAPFDLDLEGVGAFPSAAAPRVVWVGVGRGRAKVLFLAHRVREALEPEHLPGGTEEFVPHVTYFRVRSASDRRVALDLLEGRTPPPAPRSVRVQEFVLKESLLDRGGAIHRTIAAFPLAAGGGSQS